MSTHNHSLVNIGGQPVPAAVPAQPAAPALDLDALREKLAGQDGPRFWKSLEQVAETSEFQAWASHEFGAGVSEWKDPVSRRRLMQLLGASLGLAGLTACTKQPEEKIVPYVKAPEDLIPGRPRFYATAIPHLGYANGVLVESHMGRPTKIEGNPDHPSSLGATDVLTQASSLNLYDPDRSQAVLSGGRISSWQNFVAAMAKVRQQALLEKGAGLRILSEQTTSPSLAAQIQKVLAEFPGAKWIQYEPAGRDNAVAGAKLAFGAPASAHYKLDQANVVLSLDSDFLYAGPGAVRYARDFAKRRQPGHGNQVNRLYVVESAPTITGSMADHRSAIRSADVEDFTYALAAELGVGVTAREAHVPAAWLKAAAADLKKNAGASVVIAGDQQPPAVHALAHAINQALGNAGKTVVYTDSVEVNTENGWDGLKQLAAEMSAGKVSALLILGGNPVYNAPADLDFAATLKKVPFRAHLGYYDDETSALCQWHVPDSHPLEAWSDARAHDGTISIIQPLIAPLYGSRVAQEVLSALQARSELTAYQLLREFWQAKHAADKIAQPFEDFWRKSVHDGVVANSALPAKTVAVRADLASALGTSKSAAGLEVNFRPDPNVFDGRFANNGWLQELPKPLTKLTWDNAVLVAPATAQKLGVENGDIVELKLGGRGVRGPVWINPAHAPESLTVHLGYGRTRCGHIANQIGFNAGAIRSSAAPWIATGVQVVNTGDRFDLAITQEHHSMEGRDIIRSGTAAAYEKDEKLFHHHEHPVMTMYPDEHKYTGYSWGMAIDLNACTGCNACTIACQAENNIPIVGKDQVIRGREMHWIRVDRYFEGDLDQPDVYHQPVACMHCDQAPCEGVCPVAATMHSEEGLNQMVYNRCIGTRYCSNNCPYKVRRFNFFLYNDWETESLKGVRNPNVTVRSRGVMEKCTYCVQRINVARIDAEREGTKIKDGQVITACQAVCPTQAIHFGDMNDPESKIAKIKKDHRNYGLLTDLNTWPRTSYLAKLRNPNPEIAPAAPAKAEHHG
jgi:molybdopterin-containing oxidoreductase family iron-sulfur binding subunit